MFLLGWKKSTQFWSYLPLKVYENKADTLFISDTCTGTRALKMCSWASIFIDRRLLELWWNGKTASFRLVLLWKDAFLRSSIIQTCLSKRYFSEKTFFFRYDSTEKVLFKYSHQGNTFKGWWHLRRGLYTRREGQEKYLLWDALSRKGVCAVSFERPLLVGP